MRRPVRKPTPPAATANYEAQGRVAWQVGQSLRDCPHMSGSGAVASLDLMVKHGIVGETRPEVARYFLIRALDDYRRSERSAKP